MSEISYPADIAKAREVFAEKFPAAFMRKGERKKIPLRIGIADDLMAALPDMSRELIKRAVGDYCAGPKYARAMAAGAQRVDLYGQPAGEVTADAENHAKWREAKRRRRSREFQERRDAFKARQNAEGANP